MFWTTFHHSQNFSDQGGIGIAFCGIMSESYEMTMTLITRYLVPFHANSSIHSNLSLGFSYIPWVVGQLEFEKLH